MKQFIKRLLKLPIKAADVVINRLLFMIYRVEYGSGLDIRGVLFVRNHGRISIGENFIANCKMSANPVGGPYRSALVVKNGAQLSIGNNVGISGTVIICNKKITIDDNVLIGSGCCIYDTDFHSVSYEKRIAAIDDTISERPVVIGEGAFIGARTIILKGTTIGKHSVVGAGSVVANNIPDGEIWAGNPAKFIKKVE